MLPFDRRIVQLYGSCTKDSNILLVLELMQVTFGWCNCPIAYPSPASAAVYCHFMNEYVHMSMLHATFFVIYRCLFQAAALAVVVPALMALDLRKL